MATAGEPLAPGATVASESAVIDALHTVYDPEIPVDIYELGLIYELDIKEDGDAAVVMSLTAPGCPV
ncbi:MAG: iron-sulfur cluster assembly protein, partial [Rhodospirillales bacterium]|nr:iron-sulfur cluster assembly protein [Rhodospirillales bacterium]